MEKHHGLALEYEPAPTVRKQCFGSHSGGIDPECVICAVEEDCERATAQQTPHEWYEFVCPVCGCTDLEEYVGVAASHTSIFVDADGNITSGETWIEPWETGVMRCRCGHELFDEDGESVESGDSEWLLKWLREQHQKRC